MKDKKNSGKDTLYNLRRTEKEVMQNIHLPVSVDELMKKIVADYDLGYVEHHAFIKKSRGEVNIKIKTQKGTYAVKLFSKEKPFDAIITDISAFIEFRRLGIPVPKILENKNSFIGALENEKETEKHTYFCVTEFFDGIDLEKEKIFKKDISIIVYYMARLHTSSLNLKRLNPCWDLDNLIGHYRNIEKKFTDDELNTLGPVIQELKNVDFSYFKKSTIHGDLNETNILKNKNGSICILDMGCVDYTYRLFDLATFLHDYCFILKSNFKHKKDRYDFIIREYNSLNVLSPSEIKYLPLFVKAIAIDYFIENKKVLLKNEKYLNNKSPNSQFEYCLKRFDEWKIK